MKISLRKMTAHFEKATVKMTNEDKQTLLNVLEDTLY